MKLPKTYAAHEKYYKFQNLDQEKELNMFTELWKICFTKDINYDISSHIGSMKFVFSL